MMAAIMAQRKGEKLVERILIDGRKTVDGVKKTNGHLFLPEETMDFEIGVQTLRPIPQDARKATVTVTDYWGAESLPPATIALERNGREGNRIKYVGRFTVPKDAVAMGKYHELHVKVTAKGFADASEVSGFARLPKAESKKYPARDIPFQIRNWDSRIREYFELADRIGHRNIGLWGDSGWDFVESLGDNWYTGGFAYEVERNGWKNTTKEKVYKETYDLVSKHKNDKFWFICQGNEPNEKPERAKEKVEAYEQIYKAAHAAKPDITVVGTSVPALDCFFKEGFGKWCDVYDYHVYETYENVRQGVRRYRETGKKYGCEKPVWCTELGLNSQGQTRYAVAQEVVKKITAFFAEGGASVSWFTIQYPDPEGKARGSGGDCHNTFDCQYCLFNPRLDAIMYYTMINNVTVKKVVDEVQHADGVQEFLFRDKTGDSFLVAWKEGERVDRGISLPTAKDIVLTRIDGSHERLVPANGVVTLGLSGEPVMLRYTDSATKLAKDHAPAALTVDPSVLESAMGEDAMRAMLADVPPFEIDNTDVDIQDLTPEQQKAINDATAALSADFFSWATVNGKIVPGVQPDYNALINEYMQTDSAQAILQPLLDELGDEVEKQLNAVMQDYMQNTFAPYLSDAMTKMMTNAATLMATQMASGMQTQMAAATSTLGSTLSNMISGQLQDQMGQLQSALSDGFAFDADAFAGAIKFNMSQDDLTSLLTNLMNAEDLSYDGNMKKLGYATVDSPDTVSIYPIDFESKEKVLSIIDGYNKKMNDAGDEESVIQYSDFAGLLMSSVTDIIDTISLVLIAFVSISLVVSSIMISIITYISVLERKKEIGILRAMGASKGNIANVFNAETIIEGLISGVLAIAVVLAVSVPVNVFVEAGWDVPNVMTLPPASALILIGISVLLTFLAGLIPSQAASRRDPVEALRSE